VTWRFGRSRYEVLVENPDRQSRGVVRAELDGVPVDASAVPLLDDGQVHRVHVVLGRREKEHATPQPATSSTIAGSLPTG